MTPESATGLVLRTRPYTETSLLVHWITAEAGRLTTLAKGARRPKSPFCGRLDLFYEAELSFQRSRRSDLHLLREVVLRDTHPHLREDFQTLRQAAYCALLVEQVTETDTPIPAVYRLLTQLVNVLDRQGAMPVAVVAFEWRLLAELGLAPMRVVPAWSAGVGRILHYLAGAELGSVRALSLTPAQMTELGQILVGLFAELCGRAPRGRAGALGTAAG
jgi:DNA repair protein RecO (recombination protein O)